MYSMILVAALASSPIVPDCHGRHGCHGCCGGYTCYGCSGGCYGYTDGTPPTPKKGFDEPKGKGFEEPRKQKEVAHEAIAAAPATIVVGLPAEAMLVIDDQPTVSTSAVRTFATPALKAGKEYYYTLKAQVVRNGKTVTTTERVAVRAGQTSRVTLDIPTATRLASAK
jgi:uncharacterized protein (TIGR03000 family)